MSTAGKPKSKRKAPPRQRKSQAQVRGAIDDARKCYVQAKIPAQGKRPEIRQPSLDDVSKNLGIPLRTLQNRSMKEGWVAQREEFARRLMEVENQRLIQAIADQHVKARGAFFRSSLRLQTAVESGIIGGRLDMTELSAAGSALAKAQKVADIAYLGPVAAKEAGAANVQVNAQVNVGGWPAISGRPAPELQNRLASLDEED